METFVLTALAGVAATIVMSSVMFFIHSREFANADMIRALGSLVTKSEEDALLVGGGIHLVSGVIFAFFYIGVWSLFPLEGVRVFFLFGAVSGAFHGLVVSFLLISVVSGRHPLERFRQAGFGVAVAHLLGHIAYGATLGAISGQYHIRFDFVAEMAKIPS